MWVIKIIMLILKICKCKDFGIIKLQLVKLVCVYACFKLIERRWSQWSAFIESFCYGCQSMNEKTMPARLDTTWQPHHLLGFELGALPAVKNSHGQTWFWKISEPGQLLKHHFLKKISMFTINWKISLIWLYNSSILASFPKFSFLHKHKRQTSANMLAP